MAGSTAHACWLGIVLSLFLAGIHLLTVARERARTPPRLRRDAFFVLLGGFLALLAGWMVAMALRFRRAR